MEVIQPVRVTFWKDFWEEIDAWMENGEQLVIGGDWNTYIRIRVQEYA